MIDPGNYLTNFGYCGLQPWQNNHRCFFNSYNSKSSSSSSHFSNRYLFETTTRQRSLEERFRYQKHTEASFFSLQYQIGYIERLVSIYPYLGAYYYSWLKHSRDLLDHYATLMDSGDNVSFSVSVG